MPPLLVTILDHVSLLIELVGVGVLISGALFSIVRYFYHSRVLVRTARTKEFKRGLGRSVVIGLEVLVAATIVKTMIVKPSLASIGLLAGIIAIRTLISWSMVLEIEGHWPWHSKPRMQDASQKGACDNLNR